MYDGLAHTAAVTSITGVHGATGATVGTVDVSNTTHTNAGTYATDSWSFTGGVNYNSIATTTITDSITKANPAVAVTPYVAVPYDGLAHTASYIIAGVHGESGATVGAVDVSNTTHTNAGTYSTDSWSFTGTVNYNNIATTTITDSIAKATTSTVASSSHNPSTLGQSVSFTAHVTNTSSTPPIPTGSVQFSIDGSNFGGAVALSGGSASVSMSTLAVGSHTIVAMYMNADGNFASSTSSNLAQQVSYGFVGLENPYSPPPTTFNVKRTMPLKWQYTDSSGMVVNSAAANPVVVINGPYACGGVDGAGTIIVNDAGNSGYQYDPGSNSWQFNWQIKGSVAGCYDIYVKSQQSGQTTGPFPISVVNQ
jgi:hypothetical protein